MSGPGEPQYMKNKLSNINKITGFIGFLLCRQLSAFMRAGTNYSPMKQKCQMIKNPITIEIKKDFL
jgi:hypothetical protein